MSRRLIWLPLALLAALAVVFAWRLSHPGEVSVRSQQVGQTIAPLDLPPARPDRPGVTAALLSDGRPKLVNLFASWCIPCRAEAPELDALQREGVPIVGIAIRDSAPALERFLRETGNPYAAIGDDPRSRAMLSLGAAGVPETFVIDGSGRIVEQFQGPLTPADRPRLMAALQRAGR